MEEPRPRRDTVRRPSLAESIISVRAERKSGPSSSDSSNSKNSAHDKDIRDGPDSVGQMRFGTQEGTPEPGDDADRHASQHDVSKHQDCHAKITSDRNPIDGRLACSYFLLGNCAFGNKCRKWHPEQVDGPQSDSIFQARFDNQDDWSDNQNQDPRDTSEPDAIFQPRFGDLGEWSDNHAQPHGASLSPDAPEFVDKSELAVNSPVILVDEGGEWSPTTELDFGFDADLQDAQRSLNQELQQTEHGKEQKQELQGHQQQEDEWWKSPTPTPPNEQETEIDVNRDLAHIQPEEEEQELRLQHELLRELSTPMPPMPMTMPTPTETSPSKSYQSMRMSTTEASPPPKSLESVPTPSDRAYQELVDSLKLQLGRAEEERDRFKREYEEQHKKEHEDMTRDNMRELYKLREDYAKLQMYSIELMERAEASEKVWSVCVSIS